MIKLFLLIILLKDLKISLFYLKRKKIPRIVVSNIGNIQPPPSYNKVNFLSSIKYLIFRTIPKKIISAGSILGFFPKVDIRYYSNKKFMNS